MRIDLPRCNFKNCKYCFDSNCTKKNEYERCEYRQQKAEIERLQKRLEEEKHALFEQQAYTAELQKEIDATYKLLELKREEEQREHELNMDALKEIKSLLPNAIYRAKSEAFKEFAESVKKNRRAILYAIYDRTEYSNIVDNLVKEMTEEKE